MKGKFLMDQPQRALPSKAAADDTFGLMGVAGTPRRMGLEAWLPAKFLTSVIYFPYSILPLPQPEGPESTQRGERRECEEKFAPLNNPPSLKQSELAERRNGLLT